MSAQNIFPDQHCTGTGYAPLLSSEFASEQTRALVKVSKQYDAPLDPWEIRHDGHGNVSLFVQVTSQEHVCTGRSKQRKPASFVRDATAKRQSTQDRKEQPKDKHKKRFLSTRSLTLNEILASSWVSWSKEEDRVPNEAERGNESHVSAQSNVTYTHAIPSLLTSALI